MWRVQWLIPKLDNSKVYIELYDSCEAGLYEAAGIPTVICGPGHIDQAHKPDEFVALAQLAECESFLRRIAAAASGAAMGGAAMGGAAP